jgi:hypothetical protein
MVNHDEVFTRRFGGGKRTYYLDIKRDTKGERYIVISESTRKEGDRKLRNRVMVWKEDFEELFRCLADLEEYARRTAPVAVEEEVRDGEQDGGEEGDEEGDALDEAVAAP